MLLPAKMIRQDQPKKFSRWFPSMRKPESKPLWMSAKAVVMASVSEWELMQKDGSIMQLLSGKRTSKVFFTHTRMIVKYPASSGISSALW